MRIKRKNGLKMIVIALVLLLCLALAIGITGAYYQAKRQATGTLSMDQGIIIDYKGFNGSETGATWERGTTFELFSTKAGEVQPGAHIKVNAASIKANAKSVDFYARVRLEYKFYNGEVEVTLEDPTVLIKTSNLFGSNWEFSSMAAPKDYYYYVENGTTTFKTMEAGADFVELIQSNAEFIIEGEGFKGSNDLEGGGFVVDETTSINKIVVNLVLETLQGDADPATEDWKIVTSIKSVDVTDEEKTEIDIEDIISDDEKDGEITILGDPTNKLTITIGSKALSSCSELTLSNSENIEYRIATDAFPSGATIMYGIDNVSSNLINPSTDGHTEVGFDGKWQVVSPNVYLYLPSSIKSNSPNEACGDFIYIDEQGKWYFDLIDESGNKVDTSTYANTDNYTAKLNKFEPKDGVKVVVIPRLIGISQDSEKFAITKIDCYQEGVRKGAFKNLTNISSITIPNSVSDIGDSTFYECIGITNVTFGKNSKLSNIGYGVFLGCNGLTSITLPGSLISIGEAAFSGCSRLTSFTIPNSVKSIGDDAFSQCGGVKSLTIGASLNSIKTSILNGFYNLETIEVDDANKSYFSSGNCLIETQSKTLIFGCKNSVIPSDGSVTSIGEYAFYTCNNITSIIIPEGIISIKAYAFANCSSLTSITIPDSVTNIGEYAFRYCNKLTMKIGDGWVKVQGNTKVNPNTYLDSISYAIQRA